MGWGLSDNAADRLPLGPPPEQEEGDEDVLPCSTCGSTETIEVFPPPGPDEDRGVTICAECGSDG